MIDYFNISNEKTLEMIELIELYKSNIVLLKFGLYKKVFEGNIIITSL